MIFLWKNISALKIQSNKYIVIFQKLLLHSLNKMFAMKSVYSRTVSSFKTVLLCLKIFGLVQFSIFNLKYTKISVIYKLYLFIIFSFLFFLHVISTVGAFSELINNPDDNVNSGILQLLDCTNSICNQMTIWCSIIKSFTHFKQQLKICTNTDEIDELIENYFMLKSPDKRQKIHIIAIMNIIVFIIFFEVLVCLIEALFLFYILKLKIVSRFQTKNISLSVGCPSSVIGV